MKKFIGFVLMALLGMTFMASVSSFADEAEANPPDLPDLSMKEPLAIPDETALEPLTETVSKPLVSPTEIALEPSPTATATPPLEPRGEVLEALNCAKKGDANCARQMANFFKTGEFIQADEILAQQWLDRAVDIESAAGRRRMLDLYPSQTMPKYAALAKRLSEIWESAHSWHADKKTRIEKWLKEQKIRSIQLPEEIVIQDSGEGLSIVFNYFIILSDTEYEAQVQGNASYEGEKLNAREAREIFHLRLKHYKKWNTIKSGLFPGAVREANRNREMRYIIDEKKGDECGQSTSVIFADVETHCGPLTSPFEKGQNIAWVTFSNYIVNMSEATYDDLGHLSQPAAFHWAPCFAERLSAEAARKVNWTNMENVTQQGFSGLVTKFDQNGTEKVTDTNNENEY